MSFNVMEKLRKFFLGLEEELSSSRKFRPRYIELTNFLPSNDEDVDRVSEVEVDETIVLENTPSDYYVLEKVSGNGKVLAVDASSFRVGETEKGIIAAYRASIVVFDKDSYEVSKFGPFVVHLTEENRVYVYNFLRGVLGLDEVDEKRVPRLFKMVDRVRNFIERFLQIEFADFIRESFVLWDGSLTGDTVDTPRRVLEEALSRARNAGNSVFGVSKTSRLKTVDGRRLIDLLCDVYKPAYVKVHKLLSKDLAKRILGEVFAVKFSPDGFTFRVDVYPRDGSIGEVELKRLFSVCPIFNGYPDPLRLAHINCYFTGDEVLALQTYVVEKYGLEVIPAFDVRRFILYPF